MTVRKAPAKRTPVKKAPARRAPRTTAKKPPLIKLDIACGQAKAEGFVGIDLAGDADITHDLFVFPWPIADDTVSEARCSHFVEHIPHYLPQFGGVDGWFLFFDELHRILAPGAKAEFWHPYSRSDRAFWDPTHTRYINDTTWYYLDAQWRAAQGLDHYPANHDFEVTLIDGVGVPDYLMNRNFEYQQMARNHYMNFMADLHVTIKKR